MSATTILDMQDINIQRLVDYLTVVEGMHILIVKDEGLVNEIFACKRVSYPYQDVHYVDIEATVITGKFIMPFSFDENYKRVLSKILHADNAYRTYKISENAKWFLIERA